MFFQIWNMKSNIDYIGGPSGAVEDLGNLDMWSKFGLNQAYSVGVMVF